MVIYKTVVSARKSKQRGKTSNSIHYTLMVEFEWMVKTDTSWDQECVRNVNNKFSNEIYFLKI